MGRSLRANHVEDTFIGPVEQPSHAAGALRPDRRLDEKSTVSVIRPTAALPGGAES
jgi:hypothetical protein